jgi:hypothetical protein
MEIKTRLSVIIKVVFTDSHQHIAVLLKDIDSEVQADNACKVSIRSAHELIERIGASKCRCVYNNDEVFDRVVSVIEHVIREVDLCIKVTTGS